MPRLVKRKITFIASNEGCDLYSGKEFYSLKGINIYDFHARTYAPDIARFMQPDPKADDYHWLSPYTFCGGDPINYNDPSGRTITAVSNGITYTWKYNEISNAWGFYDVGEKPYEGDDGFMLELVKSLLYLLSGSTGEALVTDVVNSERIVELKKSGQNITYRSEPIMDMTEEYH